MVDQEGEEIHASNLYFLCRGAERVSQESVLCSCTGPVTQRGLHIWSLMLCNFHLRILYHYTFEFVL